MKNNILFLLLFSYNFACNHQQKVKNELDYFYQDLGGLGLKRIPLIKPYEAKMFSDSWSIRLETTDLLELSINNVKEINVVDSVIYIYSKGGSSIRDTLFKQAWYAITIKSAHEYGFDKLNDYVNFLKKIGVSKQPVLYEINEVYKSFHQNGSVDWNHKIP